MSKKQFKSQASSSRAVSGAFAPTDGFSNNGAFGALIFGGVSLSSLSYIYEPLDFGGISDPTVVVSFKNLQKKDSTTKAKALEELGTYVQSRNERSEKVEEGFLEAWVGLSMRVLCMYFRVIIQSFSDQDISSYLYRQCTSSPSACSQLSRTCLCLIR